MLFGQRSLLSQVKTDLLSCFAIHMYSFLHFFAPILCHSYVYIASYPSLFMVPNSEVFFLAVRMSLIRNLPSCLSFLCSPPFDADLPDFVATVSNSIRGTFVHAGDHIIYDHPTLWLWLFVL